MAWFAFKHTFSGRKRKLWDYKLVGGIRGEVKESRLSPFVPQFFSLYGRGNYTLRKNL